MGAAVRGLMARFSVEITPREAPSLPPLPDVLAPGTAVYLTFLSNTPWEQTVAVARSIREAGLRPVPHLAARAVPDRTTLRRMLADVAAAGVEDLLVLAGSLATPVGEFHETAQILDSGCLEEAGIRRIGVVGHPEGHPDVDDAELHRALEAKCRIARERGFDLHLVTQFCFDAAPIVAWERRIRTAGVECPYVGLPGLTSPTGCCGSACGAASAPRSRCSASRQAACSGLATTPIHHPDATLLGLATAVAAGGQPAAGHPLLPVRRARPTAGGRSTSATAASKWTTATASGRPPERAATPRSTRRHPSDPAARPADRADRALKPLGDIAAPGHRSTCSRPTARTSPDQAVGDRRARAPAEGEYGRLRDHADAAGRGQDHHTVGLGRRCAGSGGRPRSRSGSVDGPDVRDQGRRRRWRLQPGRAHGCSTAPDRRLPRGHRRAQPALGGPGQPSLPGQPLRDRPARHHLAAGARRQRPRAAQRHRRARQPDGRDPAADGLRHHRRERGHGDLRAQPHAVGDARAVRAHRGRLHEGPHTGHRGGHRRSRRHDGHHARRVEAQPDADAGEHAGPRARRSVRQHRPRKLVGGGRPHRHPRR